MNEAAVETGKHLAPPTQPAKDAGAFASILGIRPTNLKEALDIAKLISDSDLVPKDYKGKPANVLIAWEMAHALGIPPIQALQNIAVINGRACIWGELATAIVQNHPLTESLEFSSMEDVRKTGVAWTKMTRRDRPGKVYEGSFTQEAAVKAKLWSKEGTWTLYPHWMLQMRANSFCYKLGAADMLKGLAVAEEVMDYIELKQGSDGVYEMPRRISETPAKTTEATPSTATEAPKKEPAAVEQRKNWDCTFLVDEVNQGKSGEKIIYVIKTQEGEKHRTESVEVAQLAKAAAKDGSSVSINRVLKGEESWITDFEKNAKEAAKV